MKRPRGPLWEAIKKSVQGSKPPLRPFAHFQAAKRLPAEHVAKLVSEFKLNTKQLPGQFVGYFDRVSGKMMAMYHPETEHFSYKPRKLQKSEEAMGLREDDLRKYVYNKKEAQNAGEGFKWTPQKGAHGWIAPDGEYHHMSKNSEHSQFHGGYYGSLKAYKKGWISIGHGGGHNISYHHGVIRSPSNKALKTARVLAGKHFGPVTTVYDTQGDIGNDYFDGIPWENKTVNGLVTDVSTDHFVRHGTIPRPRSVAAMRAIDDPVNKSEPLSKEYMGMERPKIPHGWISPAGEFHEAGYNQLHSETGPHQGFEWQDKGVGGRYKKAYDEGWISTGHRGEAVVHGSHKSLFDPNHPANKTFRRLLANHPETPETIQLYHPETGSGMTEVKADHYIKHGTKPSRLTLFRTGLKSAKNTLMKAPLIHDDPNKPRRVWRVEGGPKGIGPYRGIGVGDASEWADTPNIHNDEKKRPGLLGDKGFTSGDKDDFYESVAKDPYPYDKPKFAFESKAQLKRWFSPTEIERLKKLGYKIRRKKATKVWSSGKQAFYKTEEFLSKGLLPVRFDEIARDLSQLIEKSGLKLDYIRTTSGSQNIHRFTLGKTVVEHTDMGNNANIRLIPSEKSTKEELKAAKIVKNRLARLYFDEDYFRSNEILYKSEDLQKEYYGHKDPDVPHGWFSPKGDFLALRAKDRHDESGPLSHQPEFDTDEYVSSFRNAYKNGWVSSAHGGGANFHGDSKVFFNPKHPVNIAIRSALKSHPVQVPEFDFKDHAAKDFLKVPTEHYIKYGTKPSKMAQFRKKAAEEWGKLSKSHVGSRSE